LAWRIRLGSPGEGVDALALVGGSDSLHWFRERGGEAAGLVIDLGDFSAKAEEARLVYRRGEWPARLILAGAGRDEWYGDAERLRVGVAAAVKAAKGIRGVKKLGVVIEPGLIRAAASADGGEDWAWEQALLAADMANYVYSLKRRSEAPHSLDEIVFEAPEAAEKTAKAIAEGVRTARDIANAPANMMNPERLEEHAKRVAKQHGLEVEVLHRGELEDLGMGGILAVGQGSAVEPRLIILRYNGGGRKVALVGKAVTFDSGGLDLKPPQYMLEMKYDKSGGAAAIGSIVAAAGLGLPYDIVALVPAVENMPSGSSYKPLDVIEMYNGLTVEIGNTDAEGRLILADALAYAAEKIKPDYMIDYATLTGAAVVALGNHAAALMGNNDDLLRAVEEAAWAAGEPAWRLPMWPVYEKQLESKTADTNNIGGRWAGAITAAKFLEKFVGDTRWAHLDIAGVAWVQDKGPWKPYYSQGGATGWGVRTTVELLRRLARA
jgi:leucyl aminopeptidase